MASSDIGPRIGIENEAEFRRQLQQINQSLKTMQSEGKALSAIMEKETDAEKKNAAQKDLLKRQIDAQKASLEKIKTALEFSAKAYGDNDERTLKWQRSMYDATASLAKMENQLDDTENEVDEMGDSMEEAEGDTKRWADVLKGSLLADALKTGLRVLKESLQAVGQAMKDAVIEGAAYGDEINTLAATTNLSAKTLQEFKYMEDLLDVSLDTVTGSLTKLTRNMNTARDGTGDAADAFSKLHVKVEDGNRNLRRAEDVFNDVIDALAKVENETERDAIAMTVFGKSAKDLNPLIKAGSDEMNRLKQEAHDSGYVLSNSSIQALNKTQDAMDRLKKKTEAVKNQFAVGLAPGVQKAASAMEKAFDNPRAQRGLKLAAEGLGKILEKVAELTGDTIPAFLGLINAGDVQLRTFTDDELELARAIEDAADEWQDLNAAYEASAKTISSETQYTQDLWKELQTLADETGNVKDADADRAAFILNQLNEALGTEYSMTGKQIEQYQQMREEIEKLIVSKEANALIGAKEEAYTTAVINRQDAVDNLSEAYSNYQNAVKDAADAESKYNQALENYDGLTFSSLHDVRIATNEATQARLRAEEMQEKYNQALDTYLGYQKTIQQYEKAEAEILRGNYDEAVNLLTGQIDLYDQDVDALRASISDKESLIDSLEAYYKESGDKTVKAEIENQKKSLSEMKKAYAERVRALKDHVNQTLGFEKNRMDAGANAEKSAFSARRKSLGDYSSAFSQAQQSMTTEQARQLAQQILNASSAFKQQAQKAYDGGREVGQNFGNGITRGIGDMIADIIAKAKEAVQNAIAGANEAAGASGGGSGNAEGWQHKGITRSSIYDSISTEPIVAASSTSTSETINLGGVTIYNYDRQVQNVDQLADKVANRLNQQIIRAKRARGLL